MNEGLDQPESSCFTGFYSLRDTYRLRREAETHRREAVRRMVSAGVGNSLRRAARDVVAAAADVLRLVREKRA